MQEYSLFSNQKQYGRYIRVYTFVNNSLIMLFPLDVVGVAELCNKVGGKYYL